MKKSIGKQFAATIILAGIILTFSGSFLVWRIFDVQQEQAVELQNEVGKRAINEFLILSHELQDKFKIFSRIVNLHSLNYEQQTTILSKMRSLKDKRHNDIIDEIVLFNLQGEIVSSASRVNLQADKTNYSWPALRKHFMQETSTEPYFSSINVGKNNQLFMIFAIPLLNFQTGLPTGILASRIRINLIWEEIVHQPVGKEGVIYITDRNGRIISHPNPSVVTNGTVADITSFKHFQHGLRGEKLIRTVEKVTIGSEIFYIVVDRPTSEALYLTIQVVITLVVFLLLFLIAGIASGIYFNRKIIRPIESLADTAMQIKAGNLDCSSPIISDNELGLLAKSFNDMTSRLTADISKLKSTENALKKYQTGLEIKVTERTTELRKLLQFSKVLANTTDLKSLYRQCVELAKEHLNFDFSTLMLLTDDKKTLVIHDTIGFPESTIGIYSLIEGQGLSTYVVKEKKHATVLNFKTESRFEVPLIIFSMNITSALCVPLMIDQEVFGVLIGHTHHERHFNDNEISFFQSFANQAAVAINNANHLQNLHKSELKFKELFDNANDAILVYDLQGSLLEVNSIACERLGYTKNELLHLSPDKFIASRFTKTLHDRIEILSDTKKEIFETAHITRGGDEIPIELSCTLFEYGGQPAILGIARDISERKKMEEELLKNRKLESVGLLAGGIAHDFNNILAAILGNIYLATLRVNPKDSVHKILISAEKAALRAKDLTQQLLTFSKGGEPVKSIASISEVIKDSADFILRGKNIKCSYNLHDNLWPVEIDSGQISQVIQNIVVNACHVMPDGGFIDICCENISTGKSDNLPVPMGDYVKISIKDGGPGIPQKELGKIFDPYFTTKAKGSGLGLAICHSIITKHNGAIFAQSPIGAGATFIIYLKASRHVKLEEESKPEAVETHRKGKLLVMDDDDMVRDISYDLLTSLGYEVVLATEGHEAIELYNASIISNETIDAIIMDLTIPGGMGGKDAVKEILQINPEAKVIVASGYSNDPIIANYKDYGFCAALEKPYQFQDLSKVVKQVLSS